MFSPLSTARIAVAMCFFIFAACSKESPTNANNLSLSANVQAPQALAGAKPTEISLSLEKFFAEVNQSCDAAFMEQAKRHESRLSEEIRLHDSSIKDKSAVYPDLLIQLRAYISNCENDGKAGNFIQSATVPADGFISTSIASVARQVHEQLQGDCSAEKYIMARRALRKAESVAGTRSDRGDSKNENESKQTSPTQAKHNAQQREVRFDDEQAQIDRVKKMTEKFIRDCEAENIEFGLLNDTSNETLQKKNRAFEQLVLDTADLPAINGSCTDAQLSRAKLIESKLSREILQVYDFAISQQVSAWLDERLREMRSKVHAYAAECRQIMNAAARDNGKARAAAVVAAAMERFKETDKEYSALVTGGMICSEDKPQRAKALLQRASTEFRSFQREAPIERNETMVLFNRYNAIIAGLKGFNERCSAADRFFQREEETFEMVRLSAELIPSLVNSCKPSYQSYLDDKIKNVRAAEAAFVSKAPVGARQIKLRRGYARVLALLENLSQTCRRLIADEQKRQAAIESKLAVGRKKIESLEQEFTRLGAGRKVCRMQYIDEGDRVAKEAQMGRSLFLIDMPDVPESYEIIRRFYSLSSELENFDERCRKLIAENRRTFLGSQLEPSKKAHYRFFSEDLVCEGTPYVKAVEYQRELNERYQADLVKLANSDFEQPLTDGYSRLIADTDKRIEICNEERARNRRLGDMQAYEGAGIYVFANKRNPINGKSERVLVRVAKLKRGARVQYNVYYTEKEARYWYRNRIRTADENFYGGVIILSDPEDTGLSAEAIEKLNKREIYIFARDLKEREAPAARITSKVIRLNSSTAVRVPVQKTLYGKTRNVMYVQATLRRGTRVRVYLNKAYTQQYYVGRGGEVKESTKPYFKARIVRYVKGENLTADQKAKLAGKDIYIHVSDLGARNITRAVFNERIPFGEETVFNSKRKFAWSSYNPTNSWAYYIAEALEHPRNRHLLYNPPGDIKRFCPRYSSLNSKQRKDFWIELISNVSQPESGFLPWVASDEGKFKASMRGVISSGLMQISKKSLNTGCRKSRGCEVISSQEDFYHPKNNLSCTVAIFSCIVEDDRCLSCKSGSSWKGLASYWSTMRSRHAIRCASGACGADGVAYVGKRDQIIQKIKSRLPYCR